MERSKGIAGADVKSSLAGFWTGANALIDDSMARVRAPLLSDWVLGLTNQAVTTAFTLGTVAGVTGALMVASNTAVSAYGYLFFLLSTFFLMAGHYNVGNRAAERGDAETRKQQRSLFKLQLTFMLVNVLGLYNWLLA